ncbi:MAG: hypothetical protein K2W82_10930 [Candidatus Obscuribacterales bacterium]|nr:hypothetical protein [Candidatus Obscuribacterales bacterium]
MARSRHAAGRGLLAAIFGRYRHGHGDERSLRRTGLGEPSRLLDLAASRHDAAFRRGRHRRCDG